MADPRFNKDSNSNSNSNDSNKPILQDEKRTPEQGGTDRKPETGGNEQSGKEKSAIGGGDMNKDGQKSGQDMNRDNSRSPAGSDKR